VCGAREGAPEVADVLVVDSLVKRYGHVEALRGISFTVAPGEVFALIGPNGAGKTTTLRSVATILRPTSGTITMAGIDALARPDSVRELISYLPEETGAYPHMTGEGYLRFFADPGLASAALVTGRRIADLGDRLGDKIGSYSKGMTRRLVLSRALMTRPRLALLDEPTSGLDVLNSIEVRDQIRKFAAEGMSVLLSSHNMLEVEYVSDRVGLISRGELRAMGTPAEIKQRLGVANLEEAFAAVAR
jgi:ABC-2 type transport system ATP-binding protein